jgi:glycosyltransferase involved in cell wall biosynthesis
MKVLYFSPRECWPLTTGARLRDYHLARQLALESTVQYLGLRQPGDPSPEHPPAEAGFERVFTLTKDRSYTVPKLIRGMSGPLPVTILNYWSPAVASELRRVLEDGHFDTVQMEGIHLFSYLPVIRAARSRPAVVADWHNIESELMWRYSEMAPGLARRLFAKRTACLIERAERGLLAACDAHTVASDRERRTLSVRVPQATIRAVPNGVDVGHYSAVAAGREDARKADSGRGEILFVGSMDYHANIDAAAWFVRQVWPALRRKHPDLTFTIVGRNPSAEVRALASDGVTVTGAVEDVRPYYARALAVIAPLRVGSGTRLKILEAMACGAPVVSTRLGAEGLDVSDREDILLADTAAEIVAAVSRLISLPQLSRSLAEAGRRLVRQQYDWSILGARLQRIHCEVIDRVRNS